MPVDHTKAYDDNNIFARILRGELPAKTVLETEHSLALHDVNPQAPIHVLVIPRGAYVSWDDFSERASDAEIVDFTRAIGEAARIVGASAQGYRTLANTGRRAHQEIGHLHVHIFGGQPLGPMLCR